MASLEEFRANFLGGARPTLYNVILNFPAAIAGSDTTEKLRFTAEVANIPGVQNGLIEVFYQGRPIRMAGDRRFGSINLTIVNDLDFKVRNAFERWSQLINGHSENVGSVRLSEYAVDMLVEQLDRNGEVLATWKIVGAWPESIDDIALGFENVDQVEKFGVTLQYQYWTREEIGIA